MESFEIVVDQTEKRYLENYKLSITYWIKHDKIIGKLILRLLYIDCAFLIFISILHFILYPYDYVTPIKGLAVAAFCFLAVPLLLKYFMYLKHIKKLKYILKMRFSQHEYKIYNQAEERETSNTYSKIKKIVETDNFLLLYPILSTDRKKRRNQVTLFLPKYIFDNQQLELLKKWINHDIAV